MNGYLYYSILILGIFLISMASATFAVDRNWKAVFSVGIFYNAIWAFCSYHTKRLGFDAILYDVCVTTFYALALIFYGKIALTFTTVSGIFIVIVGLFLINKG